MVRKENQLYFNTPVFEEEGYIGEEYTCDGYERSPPFFIGNIPTGTKSFVLLMDDLDAEDTEEGERRNQWVVWNIPVVDEIEESSLPDGSVVGVNDYGENSYSGPCPHSGEHRYEFRLYAIDRELDLEEDCSKKDVLDEIEDNILAESYVVCRYKREEYSDDEYNTLRN